jgi:hypothetical protein
MISGSLSCSLALAALLLSGGRVACAQSQQSPPGPGNQPAPETTQPARQTDDGGSQQSDPATNAKSAAKPKRVFTNDDLDGKGSILFPTQGSIGLDLNDVNNCDRNCFEQVRQAARVPAGASSQWKRDLLDGIEKVKADSQWQSVLVDLARLKGKYCQLGTDKNADLARHSDPRTVTKGEISIEEEYQRKFDALREETTAAYSHASIVAQKFSGITLQFANLQQQRIMSAGCYQIQTRYQPDEPAPDDPDGPS